MSSLTRTDVVNLALREMGVDRIDDWTERSTEADVMRDVWDHAVRMFLARHEWQFAMKSTSLPRQNATPRTRFTYVYTMPGDYIRLGSVSANSTMRPVMHDYQVTVEGFETDAASVFMEYVSDASDSPIGSWPPWAIDVLVVDLASLAASPMKSETSRERLEQLRRDRMAVAKTLSSQHQPKRYYRDGTWVSASRGRRFY